MKRLTYTLALCFGVLVVGMSQDISAEQAIAEDCSKELLLSYFPESFVRATLKKFNVPESDWAAIVAELKNQDKEVIKSVETKAASMTPNPLKDPSDRQAAVKLFRETLLGVFATVLKNHGVQDPKKIQSMLDDIQHQKAQKFAACMKKTTSSQNNDDDDDDDDEDDDDDDDDEDDDVKDSKKDTAPKTNSSQKPAAK